MNSCARKHQPGNGATIPWRSRPLITVNLASEVAGISSTSIYRLAGQGRLTLKRLAGRVLVETAGLIALIESADPWTPSDRGKAARARRSELSRARWRS